MRPKEKKEKKKDEANQTPDDDELYPEVRNGMFIPCNRKQKILLYIRFTYCNIEKIMLYDRR